MYLAGQKDRPVINQMVDVSSQQIFTIAATGNLDNLGLLVIPDKVSKSPSQNYSFSKSNTFITKCTRSGHIS